MVVPVLLLSMSRTIFLLYNIYFNLLREAYIFSLDLGFHDQSPSIKSISYHSSKDCKQAHLSLLGKNVLNDNVICSNFSPYKMAVHRHFYFVCTIFQGHIACCPRLCSRLVFIAWTFCIVLLCFCVPTLIH